MADVTLTVATPSLAGLDITSAVQTALTTTDVYYMPNDGNTLIWAVNVNSASRTMTLETPFTGPGNLSLQDLAIAMSNQNQAQIHGPFSVQYFGSRIKITTSGAGISILPFHLYA